MKVETQVQTVERIGIDPNEESKFGLAVTAEAFEILSAGIYTDPIMAVVRELSCNAYDAQVAAGKKDEPFEIHLPNRLEPWFSVKDNGIGLSDDSVRGVPDPITKIRENGLFITYFRSTKREDVETGEVVVLADDQIGSKGLGSKSPFAYSKTFEVITRFNGVRRTYAVFMNEEMIPSITILQEIDTDECNGVEIKLSVRGEDYSRFERKTAEILKYFPLKPNVKGVVDFEFDELPEGRFECDGYFTVTGYRYDSDKFTAVMGNVPYRVDVSQVNDMLNYQEREFLDNYKIVAFFKNGDLGTAASREEIRYDKRSQNNLCNMVRKARVDFIERTDKEMVALTKGVNDKWKAFRILSDKFDDVANLTSIAGDYKWSASIVNDWIDENGKFDFMTPTYHTMVTYASGRVRALRRRDYTVNTTPHTSAIEPASFQPIVILMDVSVRSSLRLNQYLDSLEYSSPIVAITPVRAKHIMNRTPGLKTIDYKKDFDDLIAALGNPGVVKLSEVSTDVTIARGSRRSGLTFHKFGATQSPNNEWDRRPVFEFTTAPDDPAAGQPHLYMLIETTSKKMSLRNGDVLDWTQGSAKQKVSNMIQTINKINGTTYVSEGVFGLTKKVVKSVKDDSNWVNIFDAFEEAVGTLEDVSEYFADKHITTSSSIKSMVFHKDFITRAGTLDVCSLVSITLLPIAEKDVLMKSKLNGLREDSIQSILALGQEVKFSKYNLFHSGTPLFNEHDFFDKYPMLKLVRSDLMHEAKIVFDYIGTVDDTES